MRILHVSDAYLPKQGGIEIQVRDLARRQAELGHQVEILTCAPPAGAGPRWAWTAGPQPRVEPPADDQPADDHLPVHRVGIPWAHVRASNDRVHRLLREREPDVVHVHLSVLSPLSILAVRAAARQRVPVVVTLHSLWWWATALYRAAHLMLGWGRWPVHWTAVSELAADPLRRIVGRHVEVGVLPNGVEPQDWAAVQPAARPPFELVVVSVMRLALRKRPRALLDVVRAVHDQLPGELTLRVVVVGDGPQRAALQRRIRRHGLTGCVDLVGRLDHAQIRELYRHADVYLAPATLESFGIAALEARYAGLPVVARRQTGIADFIHHGEHGLLAASDEGLAAALVELAVNPQLRERIAAHNRCTPPDTGWSEVLQRCELAYKLAHEISYS